MDARILDFFPDLSTQIQNMDPGKEAITITGLLTMTSGLSWHDSTDYYRMEASSDWAKYVLDQPIAQSLYVPPSADHHPANSPVSILILIAATATIVCIGLFTILISHRIRPNGKG